MLVHIVTAIILLATAAVVSIYTKKNVLSPVNVAWQLLTISLNSVSSSQPPMHVHLHTHKYTHTQIHTSIHAHVHNMIYMHMHTRTTCYCMFSVVGIVFATMQVTFSSVHLL